MDARPPWRWIRSEASGPAWNMALDEALLRVEPARPVLRTYAWAPWSLSLGYFQDVEPDEVRTVLPEDAGLVRRPTGGRAIFHGDELTYAVVCPAGEPLVPRDAVGAYEVVHGVLIRALARTGTAAAFRGDRELLSEARGPEEEIFCFYDSTSFDLVSDRRKLVGSAQRRTGRGFLMHGSIPLAPNPLTPRAACAATDRTSLEHAIAAELPASLGVVLEPSEPTPEEAALAADLVRRRYGTDRWTWKRGRSAAPQ